MKKKAPVVRLKDAVKKGALLDMMKGAVPADATGLTFIYHHKKKLATIKWSGSQLPENKKAFAIRALLPLFAGGSMMADEDENDKVALPTSADLDGGNNHSVPRSRVEDTLSVGEENEVKFSGEIIGRKVSKGLMQSRGARHFPDYTTLTRQVSSSARPHCCAVCGTSFRFKFSLVKHQATHRKNEETQIESSCTIMACHTCEKRFTTSSMYNKHLLVHSRADTYSCSVCDRRYTAKAAFDRHLATHDKCDAEVESRNASLQHMKDEDDGDNLPSCDISNDESTDQNRLTAQLQLPKEFKLHTYSTFGKNLVAKKQSQALSRTKALTCSVCGVAFATRTGLLQHQTRNNHQNKQKSKEGKNHYGAFNERAETFQCTVCSEVFKSKRFLRGHMKLHSSEKNFECSECLKKFTRKDVLAIHMRTHSNERPHECTTCGKRFKQASHLKTHQNMHDGIKRFPCTRCAGGFHTKVALLAHLANHSDHPVGGPFTCATCGIQFDRYRSLRGHERSHKPKVEKKPSEPALCPTCGVLFESEYSLNAHSRIHKPEGDFVCEVCSKKFTKKQGLVHHMRMHTGTDLFKCKVCGREFVQGHHLKAHLLTHTGEKPHACGICGRSFAMKGNLKAHEKTHLKNTDTSLLLQ